MIEPKGDELRLYFRNHGYRSHVIGATALTAACAPFVTFVADPKDAHAALLYGSAYHVPGWLRETPALRDIYRIGHFVWETDRLAPDQEAGVHQVDEIWTPSYYCQKVFSAYHLNVHRMFHPTAPVAPVAPEARGRVVTWLQPVAGELRLLSIGTDDLRKNYATLATAFKNVRSRFPQARLILKHSPDTAHQGIHTDDNITRVYADLLPQDIDALYSLTHIYVSAHHSEGWGLTLSQAMARGILTVASAHGGNLDFMSVHNSILVPAPTVPIGPNALQHWFLPEMQWGACTVEAMTQALNSACEMILSGRDARLCTQAIQDMSTFSPVALRALVTSRLAPLRERLVKQA